MVKVHAPLYAFNAGTVSRKALGRIDLTKMRVAAEEQTNLLPQVLGPMMFRPGTEYIAPTRGGAPTRLIPFVFNAAETALIELTASVMRVHLPGIGMVERPSVSATIANGEFASNINSWTDASEAGTTANHSSRYGGSLRLIGSGSNFAAVRQQVTVSETGTVHAVRVEVSSGRAALRIGMSAGADDYVRETVLYPGRHSIAFTPSGNFHVWLGAKEVYDTYVAGIGIENAGMMEVGTPWSDLDAIRFVQSGDVIFVCDGINQQRRIERRPNDSWSVAEYQTDDGPFQLTNISSISLTPNNTTGNGTLTASRELFQDAHVGALFRLRHIGANTEAILAGPGQTTGEIYLSGLDRKFNIDIVPDGSWDGTIELQRSFGVVGNWESVESYTGAVDSSFEDELENQATYYRLAVTSYDAGSADVRLRNNSGITAGVARIRSVTSETEANIDIISPFGRPNRATTDWDEGAWSGVNGYPSAVAFHDGRLFWGMGDQVFGSVSDAYGSFDDQTEGDSGPIQRSIATGGVDRINWLISLQRLLAGTTAQEVSIRASGFDEPLTPTQFTARAMSSRGSGDIQAVGVDSLGVFVQRNIRRVFELAYTVEASDYRSLDLTRLNPEACEAGIARIAVQRSPDTQVWFVLNDGTASILTYERDDEVVAWTHAETTGEIEDVCVLPGEEEDEVYLVVDRAGGRYVERMASLRDAAGGELSKTVDSHVIYDGAATATISGLDHLEGETVAAWADGAPIIGEFTVDGGSVTLPYAVTSAVVGLPYEGRFKSTKLAYGAELGTAMTFPKRVSRVALLMADVAWRGVKIGRDFDTMTGLGATYNGRALDIWEVLTDYSFDGSPFNGGWTSDSRMCIKIVSPFCATFMAAVVQMETNERDIPR